MPTAYLQSGKFRHQSGSYRSRSHHHHNRRHYNESNTTALSGVAYGAEDPPENSQFVVKPDSVSITNNSIDERQGICSSGPLCGGEHAYALKADHQGSSRRSARRNSEKYKAQVFPSNANHIRGNFVYNIANTNKRSGPGYSSSRRNEDSGSGDLLDLGLSEYKVRRGTPSRERDAIKDVSYERLPRNFNRNRNNNNGRDNCALDLCTFRVGDKHHQHQHQIPPSVPGRFPFGGQMPFSTNRLYNPNINSTFSSNVPVVARKWNTIPSTTPLNNSLYYNNNIHDHHLPPRLPNTAAAKPSFPQFWSYFPKNNNELSITSTTPHRTPSPQIISKSGGRENHLNECNSPTGTYIQNHTVPAFPFGPTSLDGGGGDPVHPPNKFTAQQPYNNKLTYARGKNPPQMGALFEGIASTTQHPSDMYLDATTPCTHTESYFPEILSFRNPNRGNAVHYENQMPADPHLLNQRSSERTEYYYLDSWRQPPRVPSCHTVGSLAGATAPVLEGVLFDSPTERRNLPIRTSDLLNSPSGQSYTSRQGTVSPKQNPTPLQIILKNNLHVIPNSDVNVPPPGAPSPAGWPYSQGAMLNDLHCQPAALYHNNHSPDCNCDYCRIKSYSTMMLSREPIVLCADETSSSVESPLPFTSRRSLYRPRSVSPSRSSDPVEAHTPVSQRRRVKSARRTAPEKSSASSPKKSTIRKRCRDASPATQRNDSSRRKGNNIADRKGGTYAAAIIEESSIKSVSAEGRRNDGIGEFALRTSTGRASFSSACSSITSSSYTDSYDAYGNSRSRVSSRQPVQHQDSKCNDAPGANMLKSFCTSKATAGDQSVSSCDGGSSSVELTLNAKAQYVNGIYICESLSSTGDSIAGVIGSGLPLKESVNAECSTTQHASPTLNAEDLLASLHAHSRVLSEAHSAMPPRLGSVRDSGSKGSVVESVIEVFPNVSSSNLPMSYGTDIFSEENVMIGMMHSSSTVRAVGSSGSPQSTFEVKQMTSDSIMMSHTPPYLNIVDNTGKKCKGVEDTALAFGGLNGSGRRSSLAAAVPVLAMADVVNSAADGGGLIRNSHRSALLVDDVSNREGGMVKKTPRGLSSESTKRSAFLWDGRRSSSCSSGVLTDMNAAKIRPASHRGTLAMMVGGANASPVQGEIIGGSQNLMEQTSSFPVDLDETVDDEVAVMERQYTEDTPPTPSPIQEISSIEEVLPAGTPAPLPAEDDKSLNKDASASDLTVSQEAPQVGDSILWRSLLTSREPVPQAHLIQLDADDTLLPTSEFVKGNWLESELHELPEDFQKDLQILDRELTELFRQLHAMVVLEGQPPDSANSTNSTTSPPSSPQNNYVLSVVIITNATHSHVKSAFTKFLPQVMDFLNDQSIQLDDLICSARDVWSAEFPFDKFYEFWKAWTLEDILNDVLNTVSEITVFSIGDDEPEREATAYVASEWPGLVKGVKVLKMKTQPNVCQLISQLQYLNKNLRKYVESSSSFDTQLQLHRRKTKASTGQLFDSAGDNNPAATTVADVSTVSSSSTSSCSSLDNLVVTEVSQVECPWTPNNLDAAYLQFTNRIEQFCELYTTCDFKATSRFARRIESVTSSDSEVLEGVVKFIKDCKDFMKLCKTKWPDYFNSAHNQIKLHLASPTSDDIVSEDNQQLLVEIARRCDQDDDYLADDDILESSPVHNVDLRLDCVNPFNLLTVVHGIVRFLLKYQSVSLEGIVTTDLIGNSTSADASSIPIRLLFLVECLLLFFETLDPPSSYNNSENVNLNL